MKKFIALALALAMMVSCLVFTASAEDNGVAVTLQGPSTVEKDGTFQVKVRVTDVQNIVGGVQGMIDVTGATVAQVQVNPELNTWNKTEDVNTIYKLENNDITFASLNHLVPDTYDTRVWFIIDYKATDAEAVKVELKNVKVSNKDAKAITTVATSDLDIDVINVEEDPSVSLTKAGIDGKAELVDDQAMLVYAENVKNIDNGNVTDIGVVFYPTSLLGGEELTIDTDGAVVANINKSDAMFAKVVAKKMFIGSLEFNFSTTDKALSFLGTKVTARVYYKTADGKVIYASNSSDNKYIKNGVANKAALNTILDAANAVTNPVDDDLAAYNTHKDNLNTAKNGWQDSRAYVLKYCVRNAASK